VVAAYALTIFQRDRNVIWWFSAVPSLGSFSPEVIWFEDMIEVTYLLGRSIPVRLRLAIEVGAVAE